MCALYSLHWGQYSVCMRYNRVVHIELSQSTYFTVKYVLCENCIELCNYIMLTATANVEVVQ
jgi:hypothetical protein